MPSINNVTDDWALWIGWGINFIRPLWCLLLVLCMRERERQTGQVSKQVRERATGRERERETSRKLCICSCTNTVSAASSIIASSTGSTAYGMQSLLTAWWYAFTCSTSCLVSSSFVCLREFKCCCYFVLPVNRQSTFQDLRSACWTLHSGLSNTRHLISLHESVIL